MILEHPSVQEIVVVGIPCEKHGQEIAALIQFRQTGNVTQEQMLEEIQGHCKRVLSSYKIPRVWRVTEEIPKTAIGKVVKKESAKIFI